jgi:hypothetical protein
MPSLRAMASMFIRHQDFRIDLVFEPLELKENSIVNFEWT